MPIERLIYLHNIHSLVSSGGGTLREDSPVGPQTQPAPISRVLPIANIQHTIAHSGMLSFRGSGETHSGRLLKRTNSTPKNINSHTLPETQLKIKFHHYMKSNKLELINNFSYKDCFYETHNHHRIQRPRMRILCFRFLASRISNEVI